MRHERIPIKVWIVLFKDALGGHGPAAWYTDESEAIIEAEAEKGDDNLLAGPICIEVEVEYELN